MNTMTDIKVVVNGALGRMGQEVLNAVYKAEGLTAVAGSDVAATSKTVKIPNTSIELPIFNNINDALSNSDVVVDFSNASGAMKVITAASKAGVNCVIGSTGLSDEDFKNAKSLSEENQVSVIIAPNFAIGAVLMTHLVKESAKFFDYADLTEVHHEAKIDSPSGTAISIAQAAYEGKQSDFQNPKPEKDLIDNTRGGSFNGVVIHSGRMPGRVAHHEMVFASLGQTLTIRHDSINRESFMPGVVMAIRATSEMKGLTIGLEKIMGLK
ncbi:MAG: 4-hydroxy-tetrahydrodipicolinate reductase [Dehalococcoidia bacterium]